jgi:tetratricopeptide (TPR) repeat protein
MTVTPITQKHTNTISKDSTTTTKYTPEGWFKSIKYFDKAVELEPEFALAYAVKAYSYNFPYYYSVVSPNEIAPSWLEATRPSLDLDENLSDAHVFLNQLLDMRKRQYASPLDIARIYAGLGDNDQALDWLEKALEERNGELVYFKVTTGKKNGTLWGKAFRTDPRWADLIRRIGVPTSETQLKPTNEALEAQAVMLKQTPADDNEEGEKGRKGEGAKIVTSSSDSVFYKSPGRARFKHSPINRKQNRNGGCLGC